MLAAVMGLIGALTLVQRGISELPTLAVVTLFVGAIGVFAVRRMRVTTAMLAETCYSVSGAGIHVVAAGRSVTIPTDALRGVSYVQSVLQPGFAHYEIATNRGTLSLPPIESPDAFAQELQSALPSVPFKSRRALFIAFS